MTFEGRTPVLAGLVLLIVGAASGAPAEPPAPPPVQRAAEPAVATPQSAEPTAASKPAAPARAVEAPATAPQSVATTTESSASAKPAIDPEEKRLLAQGYKAQMRNGEKVFCRREEQMGTRLGGRLICGTIADLKAAQEQTREEVERRQRVGVTDAK